MDRDPRENPQPGDRWRDSWGTRTVEWVGVEGQVKVSGETMTLDDWLWATRTAGGWVVLEVRS